MPSGERRIREPRTKMVEGKFGLRQQVRPAIGRKSKVARRESGDEVVLGSTDGPLCRKGAVILRVG